ncbi:hypothetical protein B5K08_09700 [Rhizobium leguminosarum bv. trifolii]|uniref:Uncharacterized protein n=1 Tax=Rhizobium leguminosarum bv. trifolii TaxID=386 RepID=A0A3E1BN08_RHILT|nr:hypothetical protein B5K08_09700 [Rhizobium leguminosarum bv. trifolii]RFB95149.1 hypothetical protein B5K11_09265 [Rhizobium leguminosarum bv. trifolii]RFB95827.1 hypothetical protein B5K10_09685 [Rhizobium leguminosarum bv. trifolii]
MRVANCRRLINDWWRISTSPSSFLCSSQESSAPKSLGAIDFFGYGIASFTARTRRGWIPVTGTGMRRRGGAFTA